MAEVTATEFCFSTPRITMQRCLASITTATPCGLIFAMIVSAIWVVRRSCTWSRRANTSTRRGILLSPITFWVGHVATAKERQQVVLTEAEDFDVLDNHHLVVGDLVERAVQDLIHILMIAAGQKTQGPSHALGRFEQPVARGILAQFADQHP
jgi:hypothetical protein